MTTLTGLPVGINAIVNDDFPTASLPPASVIASAAVTYRTTDAVRDLTFTDIAFGKSLATGYSTTPPNGPDFQSASLELPAQSEPLPQPVADINLASVEPEPAIEPTPADAIPLPPVNPFRQTAGRTTIARAAPKPAASAVAANTQEEPGFLQRLFGSPAQPPSQIMAYAPANDDRVNPLGEMSPFRRTMPVEKTAVYVIEHRTVYMPDGSKLEAHSGLGPKMDNPKYVHVRMHGATPPNTYNLVMRERLFHGVEAIRLLPTERGKMFGRDGILAHTYMLGPRGDSNGCVSFADYKKFLAAFKRGEVTRMVVVADASSMVAMNLRR